MSATATAYGSGRGACVDERGWRDQPRRLRLGLRSLVVTDVVLVGRRGVVVEVRVVGVRGREGTRRMRCVGRDEGRRTGEPGHATTEAKRGKMRGTRWAMVLIAVLLVRGDLLTGRTMTDPGRRFLEVMWSTSGERLQNSRRTRTLAGAGANTHSGGRPGSPFSLWASGMEDSSRRRGVFYAADRAARPAMGYRRDCALAPRRFVRHRGAGARVHQDATSSPSTAVGDDAAIHGR